jgi:hypothetical protein
MSRPEIYPESVDGFQVCVSVWPDDDEVYYCIRLDGDHYRFTKENWLKVIARMMLEAVHD